jgi:hypothetical protein
MDNKTKTDVGAGMEQLDTVLTEYLVKKAPGLPKEVKEFVVKFGPWISLAAGIMLLPAILALFGVGVLFSPAVVMFGGRFGLSLVLGILLTLLQMGLQFAAIPGLLKREMRGWKLAYYAVLAGAVYSLVHLSILNLIIGTGIGLYFLYQIKSYYK